MNQNPDTECPDRTRIQIANVIGNLRREIEKKSMIYATGLTISTAQMAVWNLFGEAWSGHPDSFWPSLAMPHIPIMKEAVDKLRQIRDVCPSTGHQKKLDAIIARAEARREMFEIIASDRSEREKREMMVGIRNRLPKKTVEA